jgi:hypothetical protein
MVIHSWDELRARVAVIIKGLGSDPLLALGAAANPLLALEELGLQIDPSVRQEIEDRIRFPADKAKQLQELRATIFRYSGGAFDLGSHHEVERVLVDKLGLAPARRDPPSSERADPIDSKRSQYSADPPPPAKGGRGAEILALLDALRGAHPIISALHEYTQIELSRPRLAPRERYQAIRNGTRRTGVDRVRIRFKH